MRLKNVVIHKFRNFENVEIDFEKMDFPDVFSIASVNGGGKSTLLQFIFIMLNCMVDNRKNKYIKNILNRNEFNKTSNKVADFIIEDDNKSFYLNFIISKLSFKEIFCSPLEVNPTSQLLHSSSTKLILATSSPEQKPNHLK